MTFQDICLKCHDCLTSNDVIKHILPCNLAIECLINYYIFKILNVLYFKDMHSVYPSHYLECSNIILHYITIHYNGVLQLVLYR